MSIFQLKEKGEALEVIKAAVGEPGCGDTPFSIGVVFDQAAKERIVFFDLLHLTAAVQHLHRWNQRAAALHRQDQGGDRGTAGDSI